jgi:hypothetical protein
MDLNQHYFQLIPIEAINHILLYLDGDLLMMIRSVSLFFYQMINKIINNGTHHDIFDYLFRIPNLSLSTLRSYLNTISFLDTDYGTKLSHLMLSAFTNQHITFVSEILEAIKNSKPGYQGLSNWIMPWPHCLTENMFFKQLPSADMETCITNMKFYMFCFDWITILLSAGRMDVIHNMYPNTRIVRCKGGIRIYFGFSVCSHKNENKYFLRYEKLFTVQSRYEYDRKKASTYRLGYGTCQVKYYLNDEIKLCRDDKPTHNCIIL